MGTVTGAAEAQPSSAAASGTPETSHASDEKYATTRRRYLEDIQSIITGFDMSDDAAFRKAINMVLDTGITQSDLADQIGMSRPSVSRWALGQRLPHDVTRKQIREELLNYIKAAISGGLGRRPRIRRLSKELVTDR